MLNASLLKLQKSVPENVVVQMLVLRLTSVMQLLLPSMIVHIFIPFTEGSICCVVEDVLIFFTHADRIPPMEVNKLLTVTFLLNPKDKFATASTCDLQLSPPTG